MAQKDLKNRIGSVKNIQKITRAMEMVAAARLRRAEQRIEHLRPYADAIRRMTSLFGSNRVRIRSPSAEARTCSDADVGAACSMKPVSYFSLFFSSTSSAGAPA